MEQGERRMTKEELKHEAEIYSYKLYHSKAWNPGEDMLVKAYLAGAEPREKRIADLEKENAELKEELKDANKKVVHLACNQNKDLKRKINKAKELISEYINILKGDTKNWKKTQEKAEQFLSEVEK